MRGPFLLSALVAAVVLFAGLKTVFGQTAPQPSEQQLLAATIGNLFQENARLMVELQRAQAIIAQLQKEKAAAESKPKGDAERP